MNRLILVTILWAFSFSLIGNYIAGKMDTYLAIFLRLVFALLTFLPFTKIKNILSIKSFKMMGIGFIQIGLMYIFYFNSFKYLSVVEVALFTIITPLYISLMSSFINKSFSLYQLLNVLLVIIGAAIIKWGSISSSFILGFILVQAANISFGLGQTLYKKYLSQDNQKDAFVYFYIGALLPICVMMILFTDIKISLGQISFFQWGILVWLGVVASGIGYYLWNTGTKAVSYGELAVMNNAVIPVAIIVNLLFWQKNVNYVPFIFGSIILMLGIFLESKRKSTNS